MLIDCHTANFGPLLCGSLTHLMSITAFFKVQPKGHLEPYNVVGSLTLGECLVK